MSPSQRYTDSYPESAWLSLWSEIVERYKNNSFVIGCDLRNELRGTTVNGKYRNPTWGNGDVVTDWRLAAIEAANVIQKVNPDLLIIVEGLDYALNLKDVAQHPILDSDLTVPYKLMYSSHDYSWDQNASYQSLKSTLYRNWGYIFAEENANESFYAPVWMGEFGTCHWDSNDCLNAQWWKSIIRYATVNDFEWGYWATDGTQSTGDGRVYGGEETYGILNTTWNGAASDLLVNDLQTIMGHTTSESQQPRFLAFVFAVVSWSIYCEW